MKVWQNIFKLKLNIYKHRERSVWGEICFSLPRSKLINLLFFLFIKAESDRFKTLRDRYELNYLKKVLTFSTQDNSKY